MVNKTKVMLLVVPFQLAHCRQGTTTYPDQKLDVRQTPAAALLDAQADSATGVSQCGTTVISTNALPADLAAINAADVVVTAPGDIASRLAVLSALTAVPKSLLQLFFVVAGGKIEVGDAATLCKDTPLTTEERALFGGAGISACWHAPENHEPLKLIIAANPQTIRYGLVRLFAYMHAEYFVARLQDPAVPAPFNSAAWQSYVANFNAERAHLAEALLADLAAAGSPSLSAMTQHHNVDPLSFGTMVYANAVDSYYCTAATRTVFAATLAGAYKVFADPADSHAPLAMLGP